MQQTFFFKPGRLGLNTVMPTLSLSPEHLTVANNIEYLEGGGIKKRGGIQKYNSDAITEASVVQDVMSLYSYWENLGVPGADATMTYWSAGTKLYKSHITPDAGAYSAIGSGFAADKRWDFTNHVNSSAAQICIMVSEVSTQVPQKMTVLGTSVANLAGTPPIRLTVASHINRVFGAGTLAGRLYWSGDGNGEDWTEVGGDNTRAGHLDLHGYGGITAIVSHAKDLIVFTENSIQRIVGGAVSDFKREIVSTDLGTPFHRCVVSVGNDLWFVSRRGIHSLATIQQYGDMAETYLSYPIRATFNALKQSRLEYGHLIHYPEKNQVWFLCTSGTGSSNNRILVCDYKLRDGQGYPLWSVWIPTQTLHCLLHMRTHNQDYKVIAGDNAGFVSYLDHATQTDQGTAYTATATTPFIFGPRPDYQYRFKKLKMFMTAKAAGNITVKHQAMLGASLGTQTTNTITGTGPGAGNPLYRAQSLQSHNSCMAMQLEFSQGGSNQDMEVIQAGLDVEEVGELLI